MAKDPSSYSSSLGAWPLVAWEHTFGTAPAGKQWYRPGAAGEAGAPLVLVGLACHVSEYAPGAPHPAGPVHRCNSWNTPAIHKEYEGQ